MRLSQLVRLAQAFAFSAADVQRICRRVLDRFFEEFNLPTPEVKLVKKLGVGWLARDKWRASAPDNTEIEVNIQLIESGDQLEQVLHHEMIHHYEFLVKGHGKLSGGMFKLVSHGPEFKKWAAKINAVRGTDYVTERSDQITVTEVPEFYVLVKEVRPGVIAWSWAKRPSAAQKAAIEKLTEQGWKLTKSTQYELSYGTTISPRGAYSTTHNAKLNEILKQVLESPSVRP